MIQTAQEDRIGPISERLRKLADDRTVRTDPERRAGTDGLRVELAATPEDFEAAYGLVYRQYLSYGYADENPAQLRVHLWNALPGTYTIVAKKDGVVIGTITCILDSDAGLPTDEIAGGTLDTLRTQGRRLCEVSGLAVDTKHSDAATVMRMFPTAVKLAADYLGATDYIITVNPKHERFYVRMFLFEKIGEVAEYHKVKNAPGIPMRLNLLTMEHAYFQAYDHRSGDRNLHRFFFVDGQAEMKRAIDEGLKTRSVCLTPAFFKKLFAEKTDVLRDFDAYETFFQQWGGQRLGPCREPAVRADGRRATAMTAQQLAQWLVCLEPHVSFM